MKSAFIVSYLLFVTIAVLAGVIAADQAVRADTIEEGFDPSQCPVLQQQKCPALEKSCPGMSPVAAPATLA